MSSAPTPADGGAGTTNLRLPERLSGLEESRVDLVGVASVEAGEMARYLMAAGFQKLVGHDLTADLESLRTAHRLAHAALEREEREERLEQLLRGLSQLQLGDRYLEGVEASRLVIVTQAWFVSEANRPLERLRQEGLPFYSLIQAYLDLARGEVVGVTGSHGKSTTSALLAQILGASGLYPRVWLAGNDRHDRQELAEVAADEGGGCLVLEISNRQLLQLERAPRVACITNITPNHLDEHGGLAGYVRAKRRIFELPGCQVLVRNGDDRLSLSGAEPPESLLEHRFARSEAALGDRQGSFRRQGGLWLRGGNGGGLVLPVSEVPLLGDHNLANAQAALALLGALHPPDQALRERAAGAIRGFQGLRHRLERIRRHLQVDYLDDLSSTTPQSTVAAVLALGRPCLLISGGDDKGLDFSELADLVGGPVRALLLLPGRGSDRLERAVRDRGRAELMLRLERLPEAVEVARGMAEAGETVLLSPACPGFFSAHYQGQGFRQAVLRATSPRPRREPGRAG